MLNPKSYRLRLGLNSGSDKALPHLLAMRPGKLEIQYKELEHTPVSERLDYYGLWVETNFYENAVDGKYLNQISSHKFEYIWENELPIEQTQKVYYFFADGTFDPTPEVFTKKLISPQQQNEVLVGRRNLIVSKMNGAAQKIRGGRFKQDSISFFREYGQQLSNYIISGDLELISLISTSQMPWLHEPIRDIPKGLSKKKIAKIPSVADTLVNNFSMATKIPSAQEIAEFLSVSHQSMFQVARLW